MKKALVSSLILAGLLSACGSDPIVTEMDILAAKNNHSLPKLYGRLQDDQKLAKPSSEWAETIRINLDKVGREIALEKEQKILASLQGEKALYDPEALMQQHDIDRLQQALKRSEDIEPYNKEVYYGLARQLEKVINDKNVEVRLRQKDFQRMSDRDAIKKVALLDEISEIAGGDMASETQLQKTAYIDGLFAQAESALKKKRHEDVIMHVKNLEQIDPNYPGLDTLRNSLHAEEYEQQFWDALGDGDTDMAYELFYKLSQIPVYMDNNRSIKPIAEDIAGYFLVAGKSAMAKFNMPDTYEAYSRARYIRNVLGQADRYDDGEKAFIDHLVTRINHFASNDNTLQAYSYMSVLEEMQPDHALLTDLAPELNNKVLNMAVLKLLKLPFTETDKQYAFASLLDLALAKELKATLPTKLQILDAAEKDKYSAEKVRMQDNAAGFYVFSAEVLGIELESQTSEQAESKNVLVSHQRVVNPEYTEWTALSKRAKKSTPAPENTMQKPVMQNVQIIHVLDKKKANSSVTYRINHLPDNEVTVSDALIDTVKASSKSTQALQQGEFNQPGVAEAVPADDEMLTQLADTVAKGVVKKLSSSITKMEDAYTEKAQAAFVANSYGQAASNFALRNVLLQAEGKSDQEILSRLRISAMHWQ